MVVTIPDLLTPAQLEALCSVLRQGEFVDGRLSAGNDARQGKNNLELRANAERFEALNNVVMTALVQHPVYLQTALPAKISAPIYARYLAGMEYAGHIDDPIMGAPGARYRSDISISIFLNAPEEYDGGELCIETANGSQTYKLAAGSALLYPSTCYHAVTAVNSGERLVAVTWVQSHIRRADQREILLQLDQARSLLAGDSNAESYRKVNLCYANLFRMWADS
ncbi:MAG: Fe2+-dependent dioxygenase [Gammaproteobacteria bacterium]|jgi:PKHD-type hydroxylase|nr:Fe2+-dependent dioxygenase [Gammaproteobacteria bacterium]